MILAGETLFVLETEPAAYAILAVQCGGESCQYQDRGLPDDRGDRQALSFGNGIGSESRRRRCRTGLGAMKPETSHELRGLVREVLKEAMANRAPPQPAQGTETVRIGSEADLAGLREPPCQARRHRSRAQREIAFHPRAGLPRAAAATGAVLEGVVSEQKISSPGGEGHPGSGPHAPCSRPWRATGPANLV